MNNLTLGRWARAYTNTLFRYYPETAPTFLGRVDQVDDQAGTVRLRGRDESIVVPAEYVVGPVHVVALVACSQFKLDHPAPAADLYTGQLLRASVAYAVQVADQYLILSAKYGLVEPDRVIEPYDQTLNTMTATECRRWATRVFLQLGDLVRRGKLPLPTETETLFILLAGRRYRELLADDLRRAGCTVVEPLAGMGYGRQVQWLKEQTNSGPIKAGAVREEECDDDL